MNPPLLFPLHPQSASYAGDIPDVSYGGICPDTGAFLSISPDPQTIHEALRLNVLNVLLHAIRPLCSKMVVDRCNCCLANVEKLLHLGKHSTGSRFKHNVFHNFPPSMDAAAIY